MKQLARTPKDIGHAIREARKGQRLSQAELASRSGLWQETISKIENGVASTKMETLFDVLAALDLEIQVQPRSKGAPSSMEDLF
ncbi:helix-turn-helix domain-containing protein [Rhodobacterales bacterium]|nr:helix-turn-helix domain-containing protein [Rhodobacterales bacterium]